MAKGNKKSLFWTSYSDLMTSLFFTLLVLFVVAIIAMGRALKKQMIYKLQLKQKSIRFIILKIAYKILIVKWFEYNELHKKHVLKIDVSFPIGQSEITHIPLEKREELYSAGLAIDQFLRHAEEEYGESVKYLLIIEGQASNDGFTGNFDLSYQRALSLYRYFQINRHLDLKRQNCEVLVCGSGTEGALRAYPDNASNTKNQRFLIHILPKPGVIN